MSLIILQRKQSSKEIFLKLLKKTNDENITHYVNHLINLI